MPTLQQTLLSRWNPAWSDRNDIAALKGVVENALSWSEAFPGLKKDVRSKDLSQHGVAKALRKKLADGVARELRDYQRKVAEHAQGLKTQREALLKPQFDRADIVGELQRAEVRSWLRSMEPSQRIVTLLQDKDGALVEAALGAAPTLSGFHQLGDAPRQQILEQYLENRHGPTVASLNQADEANELARVSVQVAIQAMQHEVELPEHLFNGWFESGVEPATEGA